MKNSNCGDDEAHDGLVVLVGEMLKCLGEASDSNLDEDQLA
jgi:hypothetical protein